MCAETTARMGKVSVAEMLEAAVGRGTPSRRGAGRHSRLYGWMWANFTAMEAGLAQPAAPTWSDLEVQFADLAKQGHPVQDGEGEPPSAETLRKTWGKVRRAKAKAAASTPSQPAGQPVQTVQTPAVATATEHGTEQDDHQTPAQRFKFGYIKAKE